MCYTRYRSEVHSGDTSTRTVDLEVLFLWLREQQSLSMAVIWIH